MEAAAKHFAQSAFSPDGWKFCTELLGGIPMQDVIKELVTANDVIITGVGDCGSCSAAATADGVVLEAAGVPVAAIITDSFIPTADAMAALRGAPGYKYATTAHPVAVLTEDKVKERAAQVLDAVVGLLTEPPADA